ncbi:MAG: hypothetical protein AAFQ14_17410 [Cyanobacteria bacterium J06621_12]
MESKDSTDKYGLRERCFLALNKMKGVDVSQNRPFFAQNKDKFISQIRVKSEP